MIGSEGIGVGGGGEGREAAGVAKTVYSLLDTI